MRKDEYLNTRVAIVIYRREYISEGHLEGKKGADD